MALQYLRSGSQVIVGFVGAKHFSPLPPGSPASKIRMEAPPADQLPTLKDHWGPSLILLAGAELLLFDDEVQEHLLQCETVGLLLTLRIEVAEDMENGAAAITESARNQVRAVALGK